MAATAPAATLVIRQYRAHGPLQRLLPVTALDDIYGIVIWLIYLNCSDFDLHGHAFGS